jgi:hypothetical protein
MLVIFFLLFFSPCYIGNYKLYKRRIIMNTMEIINGIFACGIIGRAIVCAPLFIGCIAGYIGCGHMAKVDETADRKSRNTRYN